MKTVTFLLMLTTATTADLNGFKPIFVPPQASDRQGISYTTNVHHPNPDPNHPEQHGAHSTIDVTFGTAQQQQQQQESRVTNVFNKDYYIPPKTIENYQKPLQYHNGVLTAKHPDSQLFNVGYSVSFADAKKQLLKKPIFNRGLQDGDIITGTRKAQEIVEKPADFQIQQQNSPASIEIIKSEELNVNQQQPQQFDHANALGRSIGFDYTNGLEGRSPIYKKYVRPGGTLEQKAEHYFNGKQPLRVVHLQTAASGAVPTYERAVAEGLAGQPGRYETPSKLPIDTRLLRNPILLPTTSDSKNNYKNDPNTIPIHFDTRQLQETFQNEQKPQPFSFPDYTKQQQVQNYQKNYVRNHQQHQNFEDSTRVFNGRVQAPLEKRGGLLKSKELAAIRQPRYTPKVQTVLRPPPSHTFQRKVFVAKLH